MMQKIFDLTLLFVEACKLDKYLKKVWIYKDSCVVVDFYYNGVRFSFDITPNAAGYTSLDIVQKKQDADIGVISGGGRKKTIARDVPLRQALELLRTSVRDIFAAIDAGVAATSQSSVMQDTTEVAPAAAARRSKRLKPMKIGVLTLPFNANIGGNLQGYALIEVLRRMGHQPILINRRRAPKGVRVDESLSTMDTETPLLSDTIVLSHAPNRAFIEKYIAPISREFYSTSHLCNNIDQYEFDAVVVGSDQVWRPKYAKSILFDFFMKFIPDSNVKIKRISYAASFGTDDWEYDSAQTAEVASLIKRFDAISVREDSGVALCRDHLGVEARHVLDPTLLLTPEHYLRLFSPAQRQSNAGQLLAYILDRNEDKTGVIAELSSRLSINAYSTTGLPFGAVVPPESDEGDASVEGWLAAIHQAAFVVTDSFHGAVFSILFNKPFIAYGNPKRGMARFVSLMKMLGLEDRLVVKRGEIDLDLMLQPIDWGAVNQRLESLRTESQEFLTAALAGAVARQPVLSQNISQSLTSPITQPDFVEKKIPESRKASSVGDDTLGKATSNYARNAERLALQDNERFVNAYVEGTESSGGARARLMWLAHAVEKGLSHADFRAGFGKSAIQKLANEMEAWLAAGRAPDDPFFRAAASVMHFYFARHRDLGVDVSDVMEFFSASAKGLITRAGVSHGGVLAAAVEREERIHAGPERSFLDVVFGRRSVREFTSEPVQDEHIRFAVRIAQQAPSVCNRQAPRVHRFTDPVTIRAAVDIQRGFRGYKMPPNLLLVTSDLSAMLSPNERNQAFIDGGLFMMSLLLGLEQVGLGSCCLNTAMNAERENAIRKIVNIPETEVFISFVAVGHFVPTVLTPVSVRYPVDEVLTQHDGAAAH
jgi:nitroreductase